MCLPQLYKNITLSSYGTIRYKDNQPEGCGSASPFSMGLNALVTRNVATLVRSLTFQGQWREHDLHEFSSVGRVPDDTMMLNIAVRAAIDRCTALEGFKWDLNSKLLATVYGGLVGLAHLYSLHIRFPSSRSPRPIALLPAMPQLRSLTVTHLDPLCYPDDISMLLYGSKKLDTLNLHWSTRMRNAIEPSVHLQSYFRYHIVAKDRLRLKKLGVYNLFALSNPEVDHVIDQTRVETVTVVNCEEAEEDSSNQAPPVTTFLDETWARAPKHLLSLKSVRHNRLGRRLLENLATVRGLERLYLISSRHTPPVQHQPTQPSPPSTTSSSTPGSEGTQASRNLANTSLRDRYLEVIITNHGSTLQHLILPDHWPLSNQLVARLVRSCPNITQLSLALDHPSLDGLRIVLPFLRHIFAIRVLLPVTGRDSLDRRFQAMITEGEEALEDYMELELASGDFPHLRLIGMGWKVWEVGSLYQKAALSEDGDAVLQDRRQVKRMEQQAVADVEIWKMDSLDIV